MGRIVLVIPLLGLAAGVYTLINDGNMMVLFVLFAAVLVGLLLLILGRFDGLSKAERFSQWYENEYVRRNAELIEIDYKMLRARGNPAEINRIYLEEYSPAKTAFDAWNHQQKQTLIKLEGVIDDQAQYELDNEIKRRR